MLLHAAAKEKLQSLTAAGFPRRGGWERCNDGNNLINTNKMILSRCGTTQAVFGCDIRRLDSYL